MEPQLERGEAAQCGRDFGGRDVGSSQKETALGDPEREHTKLADGVCGNSVRDAPGNVVRIKLANRQTLLDAKRVVQRNFVELAGAHQVLSQTHAGFSSNQRSL